MAKQLMISALFLTFVTVLSFGIRHIRFSLHRAKTIESPVVADPKPAPPPIDSYTVNTEPEPENNDASDWNVEDESEPQYAATSVFDKKKPSKVKSFKNDKIKSKDSKDLEKMALSDYENLYRNAEGQLWYVSKQPNGKTVKMQVYIDDATGDMILMDAKSGSSKNTQKIALGDYDTLYITEQGEQWYVKKEPDGSVSKSQVQIDEAGEVAIINNENYAKSGNNRNGAARK